VTARKRARAYVDLEGLPGTFNAITDVPGVTVGHVTLVEGEGVRTGVTAIHPRGKDDGSPVYAGWFSLNGNGEMTGTAWIDESGLLTTPVILTNTHSVGVARDAVIAWEISVGREKRWSLPVVAETCDGYLNDINGFHVKPSHVFEALNADFNGPVEEGNVGGGTGMVAYGFKGGIGTSSRVVGEYVVGALVQANHGSRHQLRLGGRSVGGLQTPDSGSIIVILATDAPLLPHQCRALAKRGALGLGRTGAVASITSGDLFLAFSTGNELGDVEETHTVSELGQSLLSPLYEGAVQATEEAILNALFAAETMSGFAGHRVESIVDALGL
jgi:D-aminopeptidase